MLPLIALYALSTFSLTSTLLRYTHPFFLLACRMIPAGIILLIYSYFCSNWRIQKKHTALYVHVIVFAIFLPYALRYYGLQSAHMPLAILLYNLGPIITYLLTHLFNIEQMTIRRSLAICLSFIGLLLWLNILPSDLLNASLGLPEYALLLSIISFSYGWITMRKLIVNLEYSPTLINGITMFGGGLLALASALTVEPSPYVTAHVSQFIPLLAVTIVASNLIAHNLYAALLRNHSLTLLQLGYWLVPVMHALAQSIFTHKMPNSFSIPAALLLVTGFYLLYRQEQPITGRHPSIMYNNKKSLIK